MTFFATKDPQAVLNFGINWSSWLSQGDSIATSEWIVTGPDEALVADSTDRADSVVEITVSGGTPGYSYAMANTITTSTGLTDERTITINIANR